MLSFFLRLCLRDRETKSVQLRPCEYVFAEVANLIFWGVTLYLYGLTADAILVCLLATALLGLGIVDWKIQRIPRWINRFILLLAVIHTVLHAEQWLTYVLGLCCISFVLVLVYWLTKGRGIGGGDIKLMAAAGMFLGWEQSLQAFFAACIFACVVHGLRMIVRKSGSTLAFGPYLAAGILTVLWFTDRVVIY